MNKRISLSLAGAFLGALLMIGIAATVDPAGGHFPFITLNGKTNQISDSGTALTRDGVAIGGGGDAIWTNDVTAGFLYPTTGQPFLISTNGGMLIGHSALSFWGPEVNDVLVSVRDQSLGENQTELGTYNIGDTAAIGYFDVSGNTNHFLMTAGNLKNNFDFQTTDGAAADQVTRIAMLAVGGVVGYSTIDFIDPTALVSGAVVRFDSTATHTSGHLQEIGNNSTNVFTVDFDGTATIGNSSGNRAFLSPNLSVATSTPYVYDTSIVHTSGRLQEINNNGTNTVTITYDGAITTGKQTNQWIFKDYPNVTVDGVSRVIGGGTTTTAAVAAGSAGGITSATGTNVTSISLTTGTWLVSGNVNFAATTATVTGASGGITTTSATIPTDGTEVYSGVQVTLLSENDSVTIPTKVLVLGSTTTVYLVGKCTFSAGSVKAFGAMSATRIN